MKWRRLLSAQTLLLGVALFLLWLALRNVSWSEVIDLFGHIRWQDIALLIVLDLAVLMCISARWWFVLHGFGYSLSIFSLIRYRTAVFGLSYITPGPQIGGEWLQVYFPATRHQVPVSVGLAAASVDKTLEWLGNFTFMAGGTFIVLIGQHLIKEINTPALMGLSLLLLIPLAVIITIWRGRHPLSAIVLWLAEVIPARWRQRIRRTRLGQGLPSLHRLQHTVYHSEELISWLCRTQPVMVLLAVFMTFLAWSSLYAQFIIMARALGIPLTRAEGVAALVLVYFAFLLPMPGGLGAMEAALVLALTNLGYSPSQAISLGLLMRIRDVTQAAIGLATGGFEGWRHRDEKPAESEELVPAQGSAAHKPR